MEQLFLSCPRRAETAYLLCACAGLNVGAVGLTGIGTEEITAKNCYIGANRPLLRDKWTDGSPAWPEGGVAAAEALNALCMEGDVTVLTTGPLTDLAHLLLSHPSAVSRIRRILVLGGSDSFGDVTPAAEANFYHDPEAAWSVMNCGVPIVLFGLNVTRNLDHPTQVLVDYLKDPSGFIVEEAGVQVETRGRLTLGKCVNDLYSDKQFEKKNVLFVRQLP